MWIILIEKAGSFLVMLFIQESRSILSQLVKKRLDHRLDGRLRFLSHTGCRQRLAQIAQSDRQFLRKERNLPRNRTPICLIRTHFLGMPTPTVRPPCLSLSVLFHVTYAAQMLKVAPPLFPVQPGVHLHCFGPVVIPTGVFNIEYG